MALRTDAPRGGERQAEGARRGPVMTGHDMGARATRAIGPPYAGNTCGRCDGDARRLCARVRRKIDLAQLRLVHMRVDLRGGDIRMPKDLLQYAQVGAARVHVRGERVP